jgi:hypothetical protein
MDNGDQSGEFGYKQQAVSTYAFDLLPDFRTIGKLQAVTVAFCSCGGCEHQKQTVSTCVLTF